jgi:hypothetical protein
MRGVQSHAAKLRLLLAERSIALTSCGESFLALLRPLMNAEVLIEERASGGRRLIVRDVTTLRDFIQLQFPDAATGDDALSRTIGIARFRDSKALVSDTPEIVPIQVWRDDALDRGTSD